MPECIHNSYEQGCLSLSRIMLQNYMLGKTDTVGVATELTTLILSSNKLSCSPPTLDDATKLGDGPFRDPAVVALKGVGTQVKMDTTVVLKQAIERIEIPGAGNRIVQDLLLHAINSVKGYTPVLFAGVSALAPGSQSDSVFQVDPFDSIAYKVHFHNAIFRCP